MKSYTPKEATQLEKPQPRTSRCNVNSNLLRECWFDNYEDKNIVSIDCEGVNVFNDTSNKYEVK